MCMALGGGGEKSGVNTKHLCLFSVFQIVQIAPLYCFVNCRQALDTQIRLYIIVVGTISVCARQNQNRDTATGTAFVPKSCLFLLMLWLHLTRVQLWYYFLIHDVYLNWFSSFGQQWGLLGLLCWVYKKIKMEMNKVHKNDKCSGRKRTPKDR